MADGAAYLAWRAHPKTGEDRPNWIRPYPGLTGERRSIDDSGLPRWRAAKESAPNRAQRAGTTRGTVDDRFSHDNTGCGDILAAHRERSLRARTVVRGDSSGTDASRSATGHFIDSI